MISKRSLFKFIVFLGVSIGLLVGLGRRWSSIPPMGSVLNPFTGLWRNGFGAPESYDKVSKPKKHSKNDKENGKEGGKSKRGNKEAYFRFSELKEKVIVRWDHYSVPHIFAQNEEDLFFVQGYVTAQNRLWQMELSSRVPRGRLSEIFGKRTLKVDRLYSQIGLGNASHKELAQTMSEPRSKGALTSYTQGVNALISRLSFATLPVEYKLLDLRPEPWSPIKSMGLIKMMGYNLAGHSRDMELTRLFHKIGGEAVEDLYPEKPWNLNPIVSSKDFQVPSPQASQVFGKLSEIKGESKNRPKNELMNKPKSNPKSEGQFWPLSEGIEFPEYLKPYASNGSNNWAISGKKSKTGSSIISNDTHLGYSLPNVWFETQLWTPEMNVYGVTFPSIPGIIIGFTSQVAWAVTNASMDVLDWYELEFKDEQSHEYLVDGHWVQARLETQTILVRGRAPMKMDLLWTDFGVVVSREGKRAVAMKWLVQEPSHALGVFLKLNKAKNYKECRSATSDYVAPAQNFLCADSNNIGLGPQGKFPKKQRNQGRYLMDGTTTQTQWTSWLKTEEIPYVENPDVGWVRSANQAPVDSSQYPYYLGWRYADSYRAQRISDLLSQKKLLDGKDMMAIQYDNKDLLAQDVLPVMLKELEEEGWSPLQTQALNDLKKWDYHFHENSVAATVFWQWWKEFQWALWADQLLGSDSSGSKQPGSDQPGSDQPGSDQPTSAKLKAQSTKRRVQKKIYYPPYSRSALVIHRTAQKTGGESRAHKLLSPTSHQNSTKDPSLRKVRGSRAFLSADDFKWVDDISTIEVTESLQEILTQSFKNAFNELTQKWGTYNQKSWALHSTKKTRLPHGARIPGLGSSRDIETGGGQNSVNSNKGHHGPVWKMIVELGDDLKAWVNYPGGQTGNPMDRNYEEFVDSWAEGKMRSVVHLKGPTEEHPGIQRTDIFLPANSPSSNATSQENL